MRRLPIAICTAALLISGAISAAPAVHALDAGTFTVSGWTNGNLTVDNLTIARDVNGTYTVTALTFTVGGKQAVVNGFGDRGCTPNGAECRVINAGQVYARDNFIGYWFDARLVGMDGPNPTLTMYDAKYTPQFWDGFGTSPSTAVAASLVPSTPTLTAVSPSSSSLAGGGTAEITGTNLSGATSVTLGVKAASIIAVTDSKVVVSIPVAGNNPTGTPVDVMVTTPLGSATLPAAFTFTANPPSLAAVTPSCGVTAGRALVITGFGLSGATAVTVGGQSVAFTVTDSTHIATTAPPLADVQPLVVTTSAGSSSGLTTVSYGACAPLPPLALKVTSTTPAGGFATIQWSFPVGDASLGNVLGLQYASSAGGPYVNVGGVRSGTSGSFTVSGLTRSPTLVWVKIVNSNPALGKDSVQPVGVNFGSSPTPLPPSTGNAGSVPLPVAGSGTSDGLAGSGAADAPCMAPEGSLYPPSFGTVGSQLVVAPGRPGDPPPSAFSVTSGALPPGIGLDTATGIAYGVPSSAGRFSAMLSGVTADGAKTHGSLEITVDNDGQTLTYPALVTGVVGLTMTTGPTTNAPIGSAYQVVCGRLPEGTSLDSRTGIISGTPSTVDPANPPLRVVERNSQGTAAASFVFLVSAAGGPTMSYPVHPHLRAHTPARIRPSVVGAASILYFKVIRGKLVRGLRLNPKTGLIVGRPHRVTGHHPHHITVAAILKDGTLLAANPMTVTVRRPR